MFRDIDYLKCVLLDCWDQVSLDTVLKRCDRPTVKILTVMITA